MKASCRLMKKVIHVHVWRGRGNEINYDAKSKIQNKTTS